MLAKEDRRERIEHEFNAFGMNFTAAAKFLEPVTGSAGTRDRSRIP